VEGLYPCTQKASPPLCSQLLFFSSHPREVLLSFRTRGGGGGYSHHLCIKNSPSLYSLFFEFVYTVDWGLKASIGKSKQDEKKQRWSPKKFSNLERLVIGFTLFTVYV